jgi:hypothetical protein
MFEADSASSDHAAFGSKADCPIFLGRSLSLAKLGFETREKKRCEQRDDPAGVAELVDAVALGATVLRTCRFESCPRYHRSTAPRSRPRAAQALFGSGARAGRARCPVRGARDPSVLWWAEDGRGRVVKLIITGGAENAA